MKTKSLKYLLIATPIIAIVTMAVILAVAPPRHTIYVNGVEIKNQTLDSFTEWVSSYLNTSISVSIDEHLNSFSLNDLGYTVSASDVENFFNSLTLSHRLKDLIYCNSLHPEASIMLNHNHMEKILTAWIDSIDPIEDAKNAKVLFNQEDIVYYIQEHKHGSMARGILIPYIVNEITNGIDSINLDSTSYRELANITAQDEVLLKYVETWNDILKDNIINLGSDTTYNLSPDIFHSWLTLDTNSLEFTVDKDAVQAFTSKLSKDYNTLGSSIRFTTNASDTITVPGGDYGWWLNVGETTNEIYDVIIKPDVFEIEAIWRQKGGSRTGSPIGNSYVEISLSDQHLWLYINGELRLDSPIVTGKPSSPTRRGVFGVTYIERNGRLRGPTWDVQVAYWMPFDGDIGLHDASWQPQFGGNRYRQGYGSNGCVNLPLESARAIFHNIEAGFPVVVY